MLRPKKRFLELRLGLPLIAPLLAFSNFVLIAYNFTDLKLLPFPIFTILFAVGVIIILILVGHYFRKIQQPTDFKLMYERNLEFVKTILVILEVLKTSKPLSTKPELKVRLDERIEYHRKIK